MRSASAAFMRELSKGNRNYILRVGVTLADNTVIYGTETEYDYDTGDETVTAVPYLTNENIWEGGFSLEDSVSNDDEFQIGAAIINKCTIRINNLSDNYSDYDFLDAVVIPDIYLRNDADELLGPVHMGKFIVDDAEYEHSGEMITLTCLDFMSKFEKPHISANKYFDGVTTFSDVINDCCNACGVVADSSVNTFPNGDVIVGSSSLTEASKDITYRDVVSWAAQIGGCFARVDVDGKLCIKFYDFTLLKEYTHPRGEEPYHNMPSADGGIFDNGSPTYETGSDADGGLFNPWNTGDVYDGNATGPIHVISSDFSSNVAMRDVNVTGVRVTGDLWDTVYPSNIPVYSASSAYAVGDYARVDTTVYQCIVAIPSGEGFNDRHWDQVSSITYLYGDESGYVVDVSGNWFINGNRVVEMAQEISGALHAPAFRPANITHPNDPTMEAGDVALFFNRKGRMFPIIVSTTTFSVGGQQNTTSSADTSSKLFKRGRK